MPSVDQIEAVSGTKSSRLGLFAGSWAVVGFVLIIVRAVLGMAQPIHATLLTPLTGFQLAAYGLATLIFGVVKGYHVFHLRFCPRYVARVSELCREQHLIKAVFAPLYCLNLIGSDRAGLLRGYGLVVAISLMVLSTGLMPLPWRGMILTGVAAALTWAGLEIGYLGIREVLAAARNGRE